MIPPAVDSSSGTPAAPISDPVDEDWSAWRVLNTYECRNIFTRHSRPRCWMGVQWDTRQCTKPAYPGSKAGLCLPHYQALTSGSKD